MLGLSKCPHVILWDGTDEGQGLELGCFIIVSLSIAESYCIELE